MIGKLYPLFLESSGVSTDSRAILPRSIFFALKGERFDGNSFAIKALEAGASYAVIDDPNLLSDDRLIFTEDVLTTLQQLATHHRCKLGIPIVALTGTNGKTTTKELITAVLSTEYNVTSTSGNLNNHIGVPLTILKMGCDTEIGVVEMGASAPGEIALLSAIARPDVGLITNVGKAHLLGFGSFDGVKRTKGELYDYLVLNGGVALVDYDSPDLREMAGERQGMETTPYGAEYQHVETLPPLAEYPYLRIRFRNGTLLSTKLVGGYNTGNIMAALAVGDYFGIGFDTSIKAIESYIPRNNRSQLKSYRENLFVVDTYNANPTSMRAALENFAVTDFPQKRLILGDMLELGSDSLKEHRAILDFIAGLDDIELSYFVGSEFRSAAAKFQVAAGAFQFFDTSTDLRECLNNENSKGKTFLVKGSRGVRLEAIFD